MGAAAAAVGGLTPSGIKPPDAVSSAKASIRIGVTVESGQGIRTCVCCRCLPIRDFFAVDRAILAFSETSWLISEVFVRKKTDDGPFSTVCYDFRTVSRRKWRYAAIPKKFNRTSSRNGDFGTFPKEKEMHCCPSLPKSHGVL